MNLKERINADFVIAFKSRNERAKTALSMLKSKITEAEKSNGNKELDDQGVLKVIISSVKQRNDSISQYTSANRMDLVEQETAELNAIEVYMPKQMTDEEMSENIRNILHNEVGMPSSTSERNKAIGMTIGKFNKAFAGRFDNSKLKGLIEKEII
jgi:uncharacterized protein YqeY